MASSLEYVQYVAAQLSGAGAISYKKLFGEYGLWCGGTFFGTVENNQFYIKVTEAGHKSGCNVYICGELAADSNLTEKFIQMGVDGLSVVPACVLPVRKAIRAAFADASNRPEEQ